ncbi:MAG: NAD-dependent epimerase/dehydratase family protein, partial [Thermoleophilaceae bacterium]
SYAAMWGLPVAVTRIANVYGGGDLNWSRLIPGTARALMDGTPPVIRSYGSPERDCLCVDDAIDVYLTVAAPLFSAQRAGCAWNAGWGEPHPVREVVNRLVAASGVDAESEVRGEGVPRGEIDRQYLDASEIERELGWRPKVGLDEGLMRTWEWYRRRLA